TQTISAQATALPFAAQGTFTVATQGNRADVTGSGTASPGGAFTFEDIVRFRVEHGVRFIEGTITIIFTSGSTLTFYYEAPIDATGVVSGPYWVTGRTGPFAGATGSGTITYPVGQNQPFTLSGTITL